ncbi:unnamed protein product, partial [Allacma fusca]
GICVRHLSPLGHFHP